MGNLEQASNCIDQVENRRDLDAPFVEKLENNGFPLGKILRKFQDWRYQKSKDECQQLKNEIGDKDRSNVPIKSE